MTVKPKKVNDIKLEMVFRMSAVMWAITALRPREAISFPSKQVISRLWRKYGPEDSKLVISNSPNGPVRSYYVQIEGSGGSAKQRGMFLTILAGRCRISKKPQPVQGTNPLERLKDITYMLEHSPHCPSSYLVRLPNGGYMDRRPAPNTRDKLFYGKSLEEAVTLALASA